MSGDQNAVSLVLNEQIEPIVIALPEPMSVRQFMQHADNSLKGTRDDEGNVTQEAHQDYGEFTKLYAGAQDGKRKPSVNTFPVRYGYPRALKGGELLSFEGKGELGSL